jgi:superfamily II DNA or RNA helicase
MSTHRERNNQASKKSYEKAVEREHATAYEHAMIEEHRKRPHTRAWHWSVVPEDELFEAGYIHDFSKHRHLRLMNKKRMEEGQNRLRDYGLDGLAMEVLESGEVVYHGLQAKYYQSRTVTAEDIGSFFAKQISMTVANPLSRGYLYTTTRLQVDLADEVAQPKYPIRHVLFPWKHPDRRMAAAPIVETKETEWPLRDYQQDTLRGLIDGRNAICIPCRMGKTVIAGHWVRKLRPRVILAIAPLKVSVENLRDRLTSFLPTYSALLVDSDEDGTTDEKEVEEWLAGHDGPIVVYSTYDSALAVLSQFEWPDEAICVVDEAHNASEALCEWVCGFRRCLAMSATFPEEIGESMGIEKQITLPFSKGIEGGYLVDYTLWLPSLTRHADGSTSVEEEVPVGFEAYERSMVLKALFHATGMLRTGARRTVVYLSSQAECDQYMDVCRRVFEEYHGVTTLWIEKMTCTVRQAERKAILDAFLGGDGFRILTSVRILDEAVDLPACDSVFITTVGDKSSDIRFFQRAQRGGTLDPKNPNKRNHIFLWAEGWESCVGALSMLREADPEFHRKVRHLPSYDRKETVAGRAERVEREREEFAAWSRMACETVEARVERKARMLLEWVEREGRVPPQKEVVDGVQLGVFWYNVKGGKVHKDLYRNVLYLNAILRGDFERSQKMKEEKAEKGVKTTEEKARMLLEWVEREGKVPPARLVVDGVQLGVFWTSVKMGKSQEIYRTILSLNETLRADYERVQQIKEKKAKKP